jgi:transposase
LVDALGNPVAFKLSRGELHDSKMAETLLTDQPAEHIIADKAYDTDAIRQQIQDQGAEAVIPSKKNRVNPIPHDRILYKERNLVERFFNKIKHCRRIATRYDKLDSSYMAFIHLAAIEITLR